MNGALKNMWPRGLCIGAFGLSLMVVLNAKPSGLPALAETSAQVFAAKGVVRELSAEERTITISHEAVSNYMEAMTMPFKVKDTTVMAGLHPGDEVTFRLHVTQTDSWVDQITRTSNACRRQRLRPASVS